MATFMKHMLSMALENACRGSWPLAYMYANEALRILGQKVLPTQRESLTYAEHLALLIMQNALFRLVPKELKQIGGVNHHYAESLQSEAKKRLSGFATVQLAIVAVMLGILQVLDQNPPPRHQNPEWPIYVELDELSITWPPKKAYAPECTLRRNGIDIPPKVPFKDLPVFFYNHANNKSLVRKLHLGFNPDSRRPTQGELKVLLQTSLIMKLNSSRRLVPLFSEVKAAELHYADFHDITEATFYQLFAFFLAAEKFTYLNLKRLPIGVHSADFLLYPSLVASEKLIFSVFSPDSASQQAPIPEVVQFTPEAVIAHIHARERDVVSIPSIYFHEAYLADAGGATAMVEKATKYFISAQPTALFILVIYCRHASSFDSSLCDVYISNSLEEAFTISVTPMEKTKEMPNRDDCYVKILKSKLKLEKKTEQTDKEEMKTPENSHNGKWTSENSDNLNMLADACSRMGLQAP